MPINPYSQLIAALEEAVDVKTLFPEEDGKPIFGAAIKPLFGITRENRSLNFGSCGNPPLPIIAARLQHTLRIDRDTDVYMRRHVFDELDEVRNEMAQWVKLPESQGELFLVENAGWSINAAINSLALNPIFHKHQRNVRKSTTFKVMKMVNAYPTVHAALAAGSARFAALRSMCNPALNPADLPPTIDIAICHLTQAMFADESRMIEEIVRCALTGVSTIDFLAGKWKEIEPSSSAACDVVIIDHLMCGPACVVPVAEICKRIRQVSPNTVIVLDGAHALGMIPLAFEEPQWQFEGSLCFDVYFSNCHKWLLAPKSTAMFILSTRVIRFFHPNTVANFYRGEEGSEGFDPNALTPAQRKRMRLEEFVWQGTRDFTNELAIKDLLAFRRFLGEERIQTYNRSLCYEGAELVAKLWGSRILLPGKERNGAIISVVAPDVCHKNPKRFIDVTFAILDRHHTYAPPWVGLVDKDNDTVEGVIMSSAETHEFDPLMVNDRKMKAQIAAAAETPSVSPLCTIRFSCQLYNTIEDFEYYANTFLAVWKELSEAAGES